MKPEFPNESLHSSHTLIPGTILNQCYHIDSVLGEGGFGITYAAHHIQTGEKTAIKEFFPAGLVTREYQNGIPFVSHFQGQLEETFKKGLKRFLNEASSLQTFHNLPNLVSVQNVFEENGTAYFVMEYIEGVTLKEFIDQNGPLSFDELFPLMIPVLEALVQIHKKGIVHRDISPDNLMLSSNNLLYLIDFGASSLENPNETKTMTVILKAGYAPPEQYLSDGKIGAWTDVYGICATMYTALTGTAPQEAIRRIQNDTLTPPYPVAAIRQWQSDALMKGLALDVSARFRNVEKLYDALTVPPSLKEAVTVTMDSAAVEKKGKKRKGKFPFPGLFSKIIVLVALSGLVLVLYATGRFPVVSNPTPESGNHSNTSESVTSETTQSTTSNDEILTMINMVNSPLKDAKNALSELDSSITVKVQKEYDKNHNKGIVTAQSIAEQTQFTRGQITQIILTVSKGTKPETATTTSAPPSTRTTRSAATTAAPKSTSNTTDEGYKVNGTSETKESTKSKSSKQDYTTIHLD